MERGRDGEPAAAGEEGMGIPEEEATVGRVFDLIATDNCAAR
jgi:hypothetical protein